MEFSLHAINLPECHDQDKYHDHSLNEFVGANVIAVSAIAIIV